MATQTSRSGSFLDSEHSVAGANYSRWLVPPAALSIHLSIGQAYAFSVFNLPLSHAIGISTSAPGDWKLSTIGWVFSVAIVFLGVSAAVFGPWLERAGPRKAMFVAAMCFASGFQVAALGVATHQFWLLLLGYGVLGGIGLGLGYISPVSTLIKWFPDRPGMATGLAIMGFGGGAMVGAPLADKLMKHFATPTSVGVWETFLALAAIYFVFMMAGALGYRVPAAGWKPAGWTPPAAKAENKMITTRHVHVKRVWGIPQFWLVWLVLFLNVSAGIGILAMASPILQEVFGGRLIGLDLPYNSLDAAQKGQIAAIAAGFTGLLSLFNIGGRFAWASCSDYIGRKATYFVFLVLGLILYASIPTLAHSGQTALFVGFFCIILSMYGGGFSTVPAYLADLFGTQMVGAIHGWVLTAWSAAGLLGTTLVNYVREYQIAQGVPKAQAYDTVMYMLVGLLVLGVLCNLMVRPLADKHFMTEEELANEKRLAREREVTTSTGTGGAVVVAKGSNPAIVLFAWAAVGIPIVIGMWLTLQKAAVLFK
jgi:MFS family permease